MDSNPVRSPPTSGTRGTVEWMQELPTAARASRIVAGHPEGFHEGFAARRAGRTPDPLAMHFPTAHDGLMGVAFVGAAIRSSISDGAWTSVDG